MEEKPKLHWKHKLLVVLIVGGSLFFMIFGSLAGEPELVNVSLCMGGLGILPLIVILRNYYRDVDSYEEHFERVNGISYAEYVEKHKDIIAASRDRNLEVKRRKAEFRRLSPYGEDNWTLFKKTIKKIMIEEAPPVTPKKKEESEVSKIIEPQIELPTDDGSFIRNGALSYEEVMERRETFKPVYVTAKHCFGVVDREHDFIALENGDKIPLSTAFITGLYATPHDEEDLDVKNNPNGGIPYRELLGQDHRPVYMPEFNSWGCINMERQEIWLAKYVVPSPHGKTNRIPLYEASKLGVYFEEDGVRK